VDWPRSTAVLTAVADRLAEVQSGGAGRPVRYFWPGIPLRNLLFLGVILAHGFRRLFPPY